MCTGGSGTYPASRCRAHFNGRDPFSGTRGTLGWQPLLPHVAIIPGAGGHWGQQSIPRSVVGAVSPAGLVGCSRPAAAPDGFVCPALLRALFSVAHSTLIHKVGNTTPCSAV